MRTGKLKVIVASNNPVKINATRKAFEAVFDQDLSFHGASIPSDVADQPMSDEETLRGALNRTNGARENFPEAAYWVGIEGGVDQLGEEMYTFAWIVVQSTDRLGKAKSASIPLAPLVVKRLQNGEELGLINDDIFGQQDSKKIGGAAGLLTRNLLSREKIYREAIILALVPFMNEELYTT